MAGQAADSREFEVFMRNLVNEAANVIMSHLPELRKVFLNAVDLIFIPKQIARQIVLVMALKTSMVTANQLRDIFRSIAASVSTKSHRIRQLHRQQHVAKSQDEWMELAQQIDIIQGNDIWRAKKECTLYESDKIQARIDKFVYLLRSCDIFELMFTLRGGIGRNHFGLLHDGLFSRSLAGTKNLIETYHNVVCAALDFVCDAPVAPNEDPIPSESRLAFFNETRHSYGRTAFLCSGGAALGFYHVGVVKALMLNGLMPRVLGGSSAGSIVTAIIATRTDEECIRDFFNVKGTDAPGHSGKIMTDFFRPVGYAASSQAGEDEEAVDVESSEAVRIKGPYQLFFPLSLQKVASSIGTTWKPKHFLRKDTLHLENCLRANIGDFTFQEAFDRTGRILNITVSSPSGADPPRLLNYLTSPHVLIWSAALASSSLPGVFEANRLIVKDANGTEHYESTSAMAFQDGSMTADLPMQQLSEMFNVNHFLVSQVNPNAVMFASFGVGHSVWDQPVVGYINGVLLFLKNQLGCYLRNVFDLCGGRRIAPLWDQFFTQERFGRRDIDISIIPWQNHRSIPTSFFNLIKNPTPAEVHDWINAAERETWRYIPRIKSHCAEERTLDLCVQRLRKRIMAETWTSACSSTQKMLQPSNGDGTGKLNHSQSFPNLVCLGGLGVVDKRLNRTSVVDSSSAAKVPSGSGSMFNVEMKEPTTSCRGSIISLPGDNSSKGLALLRLDELTEENDLISRDLNDSFANLLESSPGDSSEKFTTPRIEQDDPKSSVSEVVNLTAKVGSTIVAPDADATKPLPSPIQRLHDESRREYEGYIKTTSMANFYYYRKSTSQGNSTAPVDSHCLDKDKAFDRA